MSVSINLVIAGVGGQGTLVAGKLFGAVATKLGLDVKVSEVHGMSQRGGSVVTYVRIGEKVHSPVVEKGSADFILAFEELEAQRYAGFLAAGGRLIVNRKNIIPVTVRMGKGAYPQDIPLSLKQAAGERAAVISVAADETAHRLGNARVANMVMTGALSAFTEIGEDVWAGAIDEIFPEKLRALNKAAFREGREAVLLSEKPAV